MNAGSAENEIRRLLRTALSRFRRKARSGNIEAAHQLDLNKEFEESSEGVGKYSLAILVLFGLLCAFCFWMKLV